MIYRDFMEQREVWETLADSWTHLHVKPEDKVIKFSNIINKGPVLDLGCGNCRNSLPFLERKIDCVGIDYSKGMVREAKKLLKKINLNENLVIGNLENLPFKKGSFLSVICIRTLHHLETKELRLKSLKEMIFDSTSECCSRYFLINMLFLSAILCYNPVIYISSIGFLSLYFNNIPLLKSFRQRRIN